MDAGENVDIGRGVCMKEKKPTIKQLQKQCDDLFSRCVRTQHKTCRICNSDDRVQAHHIRSRTHLATRYDLSNGFSICFKHHSLQYYSPEKFQDMIIDVIGDAEYKRLKQLSLIPVRLRLEDYKAILERLKHTLKQLENEYGGRT